MDIIPAPKNAHAFPWSAQRNRCAVYQVLWEYNKIIGSHLEHREPRAAYRQQGQAVCAARPSGFSRHGTAGGCCKNPQPDLELSVTLDTR